MTMTRNTKYDNSNEETVLLRLIRGEPLGPALGSCNPEELTRLAIAHKVLALLSSRMAAEKGVDATWKRCASCASLASDRDARLRSRAAQKTVALLEADGILPVVLKGPSLALGRPRDEGDVDLLIPISALTRAIGLLEGAGYDYRGYERNMFIRRGEYRDWKRLSRWSAQFEFLDPDTGTLIELHTAFFETARVYLENLSPLRAAMDEFIASSVTDATSGYRFLTLENRALLLALHAGIKRAPYKKEFILRHLADLRTLSDAGLDWELLAIAAFRFGAAHHLVLLLRLHETYAGPCAPPGYVEGLEARLSPAVRYLIRLHLRCLRGLHGVEQYDRKAIFLYQLISPFVLKGTVRSRLRSLLVLPLVFPPLHQLANIYGLPQRSRLTFLYYLLEPPNWFFRQLRKVSRLLITP